MIEWGSVIKFAEPVLRVVGGPLWRRYQAYAKKRDIRLGSRTKIGIIIGRLAEDTPTDGYRTTLYETIRRELGDAVELTTWPEVEVLGDGYQYDVEKRAYDRAQKLLKDRGCDLLVSGRIKGRNSDTAVLSLRLTVAETDAAVPQSYTLTETFDLPADFVRDLGAAIAARVVASAAPAIDMNGQYLVPLLRERAGRLAPLAAKPSPRFSAETRGHIHFSLAMILFVLGEQEGSNPRLAESIEQYQLALQDFTRDDVPLQWAATQNNLGNALRLLGERESGTVRLEQAVEACLEALKEHTRERVPLDWAMTQNNLGNALAILGERESGTARLEEAVAAYREALQEYTRKRVPLGWAMTQNNLGNALRALGARASGTVWLEQAVAAYCEALKERTRERVPLDWAMTQSNLGNALRALGDGESGTARLEQAVAAYGEALKELTRERMPLQWAGTQNNLGNALQALGERESGTARLEQAVAAYCAALDVFEAAGAIYYVEKTRQNLARSDAILAERRKS